MTSSKEKQDKQAKTSETHWESVLILTRILKNQRCFVGSTSQLMVILLNK